MIYEEACEFFWRYGNVGRTTEDIMKTKPTPRQLHIAFQKTLLTQTREMSQTAVDTIIEHWEDYKNED